MSDRELLEAAANAAGYQLDYSIRPDGKAFYHSDRNAMALADGGWFAPLTDDGDALRLAVKLGLHILPGQRSVDVGPFAMEYFDQHAGDQCAATRRAIVRAAVAAAALGRAK